ncbi:MAG: Fe-S-oxidoreductase [Chitinophagaceae bacterium]|nr:Fe-S-oxidoreductase [Chitinophagaceae bacterium]
MFSPQRQKELGKKSEAENKRLVKLLKKKKPTDLDEQAQTAHEEAFGCINCLECAMCCITTGPLFTDKDISRLAQRFRIKDIEFRNQYLRLDEDNDWVLKQVPCPFLGANNYCSVYEDRPKACREYPHTDKRKFVQILDLTLKNTFICPAAHRVMETLQKTYLK